MITDLTRIVLVLAGLHLTVDAWLFSYSGPEWNGLQVTWGLNPFSGENFDDLPRTVGAAVKEGFKMVCDCDTSSAFRGARYVKDNDFALVLLFDVAGTIAGIQTAIPKNLTNGYPDERLRPPFIDDGDRWALTAYFVPPSTICSKGRDSNQFHMEGTGLNLYIQNGSNPEAESILIPKLETDLVRTKWTEGECFYTMGKHYWYNLSLDMDCRDFFPVFLMYNGGKLNSFGWAMNADLKSPRYEHPTKVTYDFFFKKVPRCFYQSDAKSTLHIYLTDNVLWNRC